MEHPVVPFNLSRFKRILCLVTECNESGVTVK